MNILIKGHISTFSDYLKFKNYRVILSKYIEFFLNRILSLSFSKCTEIIYRLSLNYTCVSYIDYFTILELTRI